MKKYLFISLLLHMMLFLPFLSSKQLGDEKYKKFVPLTFISKKNSPNPGSKTLNTKEKDKIQKPKEKTKKTSEKKIKNETAMAKNNSSENKQTKSDVISENSEKYFDEISEFNGSNFLNDGDGGYIALSSKGINYEILKEVDPEYPEQAEMIGYSKKVLVTVKFLVDLNGNVEKIEIIKSHSKLGFDDEVKKAVKKWKFKPIFHHGKNIKVYFIKDFIFTPK